MEVLFWIVCLGFSISFVFWILGLVNWTRTRDLKPMLTSLVILFIFTTLMQVVEIWR